jgi:hypothetical protein
LTTPRKRVYWDEVLLGCIKEPSDGEHFIKQMASKKELTDITREKLDGFRGKMKKFGVNVPEGDDVQINAPMGVKMRAKYDETAQTLLLEIVDKPIFVPEAQIWSIVEGGT